MAGHPTQGVAQRNRIGGDRTVDFDARQVAYRPVESEFHLRPGNAQLEPGHVAGERGRQVGDGKPDVERFVAPGHVPGRRETLGDQGPGKRQFDLFQRLGAAVRGILDLDDAVADVNFRERQGLRAGFAAGANRARQRIDQRRPIGAAFPVDTERDARMIEGDIGNFEAPRQQRQPANVGNDALNRQRRIANARLPQRDIAERYLRRREQRQRNRAAHRGLKSGRRLDLRRHGVARRLGRHEVGDGHQQNQRRAEEGPDGNSKPFESAGSAHAMVRFSWRQNILCSN